MADTIRKAAQPPAAADAPLDLVLRGACALAAAVAQKDTLEAALAALPPAVRARFSGADGAPEAAFVKLYEALQETEPTI